MTVAENRLSWSHHAGGRHPDLLVEILNPPTCPETVSSGEPGGLLGPVLSVERVLELGWWDVAAVLVQTAVVVPVDPLGGRDLDGIDGAPWPAVTDHFGLVRAVDGLGQGVVVRVAHAADRGGDPGLDQPFGVTNRRVLLSLGSRGGRNRSL